MKKLRVTIMALVILTAGTAVARAGLVAGYPFDGSLCDCSGNDYDGQWCSLIGSYSSDVPPGFGGQSLCLDGTQCVELPLGAANPLDYTADCSIVMWFKVPALPAGTGALLFSSARDNTGDNHSLALFLTGDGELRIDMFWVGAVVGDTAGLDDGTWHHAASVFDQASGVTTLYVDGVEDGANDDINQTIPNIVEDTILVGDTLNEEFPAEEGVVELVGCVDNVGIYDQALTQPEVAEVMNEPVCYGCPCLCPWFCTFDIDPNVMTVYEQDETLGDFDVSLKCEPTGVITVTVDPDPCSGAANDDFILLGSTAPDGSIALTFDPNDWDIPQIVAFQAVDDDLEEGPDIDESHTIVLTTASADPNWDGRTRDIPVTVQDNDYVDILFTVTPPEMNDPKIPVTGPVQLWEEPRYWFGLPQIKWRNIGVTLQVLPSGGPVKLNAEVFSDASNPPLTDPCLPYEETDDPNGLIFTAGNYNISQNIKIWANDDDVLQAIDAVSEGDQNYQATLVFTVIDDGGDERFTGMERTVQFDIEDNECGAWGISYLDIGNPNAFTDPNFCDEDGNPLPDCHIDIYDVVEMVAGWLRCTNPKDENCWSML